MKLELKILLTTLFLITLSYPVCAGTSFTGLSGKVTVLDLAEEKKKSDIQQGKASSSIDFYRWIFYELDRNMDQPILFQQDMALLSEQIKREGREPEFISKEDRNNIRLAVRDKDYVKAREIVKVAEDKLKAGSAVGASVVTMSEVIE